MFCRITSSKLSCHRRWRNRIQAIFLNLFYFTKWQVNLYGTIQIPFLDERGVLEGPPELFVDRGLLWVRAFNFFWVLMGVSPGASRPPCSWGIRTALKSTPTEMFKSLITVCTRNSKILKRPLLCTYARNTVWNMIIIFVSQKRTKVLPASSRSSKRPWNRSIKGVNSVSGFKFRLVMGPSWQLGHLLWGHSYIT